MSLRQSQVCSLPTVFTFIFALMLSTLFQDARAENVSTEEWNIAADSVVRYEDPSSIVAQGNVILEKKEKLPPKPPQTSTILNSWSDLLEEESREEIEVTADEAIEISEPTYETTVVIKADWLVYDVEVGTIKVKGNVHIKTAEDELFAKEGSLSLENETGTFTDATILREELSMHLEGASIEKTGFDTYRIVDGWVITCKLEEGQTPPWSFSSSQVDVRPGGYAVLKHAKFNIKDVPVLYSPYLIVPVKNTRQSGFLFPEFSTSDNNGFGFNLPYFLNISESTDITFYPEYLEKRGFKPGLEFRYVESVSGKGAFNADYLDDDLTIDDLNDSDFTHDNSNRYWVRGKVDHTFGSSWQSRLDVDIVSDQDYLTEFEGGMTGFNNSQEKYLDVFGRGFQNQTSEFRENTFKTLRTWSGMSLEASLFGINEANTDASENNTPLWELPRVDFSGVVPIGDTNFDFDWNADYVDYWREDGIGGHRFDLHPTVAAPIPLSGYLESRAQVGLRDTFYIVQTYGDAEWNEDDTQNRLIPDFEVDVATTFERDFFSNSGDTKQFSHQFRPFVQYNYIPDVDQDDLPYFDSVDDISEQNTISYGIDNFFDIFNTSSDNKEKSRDFGEFKIEQSYDLMSSASDEPFSEVFAKLRLYPLEKMSLWFKTYYDVYDKLFTSHNVEANYTNSRGDYFMLEYSFKEADDIEKINEIEQINASVRTHVIGPWFVGAEIEQSISEDETVKANGSLIYQAPCWSVEFETRYTPLDTTYYLMFNLANIGIPIGINM